MVSSKIYSTLFESPYCPVWINRLNFGENMIKIIQVSRRAVYTCPRCGQYVSIDLKTDELTEVCPLCGQDITKKGE